MSFRILPSNLPGRSPSEAHVIVAGCPAAAPPQSLDGVVEQVASTSPSLQYGVAVPQVADPMDAPATHTSTAVQLEQTEDLPVPSAQSPAVKTRARGDTRVPGTSNGS